MSFKRNFFKNLLVSSGYLYVSQLIIFIASFATSRLLSPADFGLVGLITVFSGFINVFSDSGITMAVIRSPFTNTFYRGLNAISVLIGAALFLITLLLIYPIALFYKNQLIVLPGVAIAFLFIIRSFITVPMAILQKNLQFSKYGKVLLISTLFATIGTIIMAYSGFKFWSLIWSQYINAFVSIILLFPYLSNNSLIIRKAVFVKSFKLTKTLIGSLTGFNIINYWARNSDNLIVGKFYGAGDLGIYNRAYLMLQLPLNLIAGLFTSVLFPSLTKLKNEGGNIENEYLFVLKLISILNLPVSLVLILLPNQFVTILWGKNWVAVASLLPYFGLLVMIQTLIYPLGSMLVLAGKEKVLMIIGWAGSGFIIAGIIYGATISLYAIAAFYSLFYIILVLPLNIFYGIKKALGYTGIINFWLPKFILCIVMWFAIYHHINTLLLIALLIWIIIALANIKQPAVKLISNILNTRLASK